MKKAGIITTLALVATLLGVSPAVGPQGVRLVAEARADAEAKVSVAVIKATKSGGVDEKSKKYESVISQVGGYTGFSWVSELSFAAGLGQTVSKEVAGRKLAVLVKAMTADKVTTSVTVVDPNGKEHAVSSSTKPGASVVVAARSADGSEAYLFIVTVRY